MENETPVINFFNRDSLGRTIFHRHELGIVAGRAAFLITYNLVIPENHIIAGDLNPWMGIVVKSPVKIITKGVNQIKLVILLVNFYFKIGDFSLPLLFDDIIIYKVLNQRSDYPGRSSVFFGHEHIEAFGVAHDSVVPPAPDLAGNEFIACIRLRDSFFNQLA